MESREDFYFDDSDNPGSDDMIEKEEHYIWTIALEAETKEDAFIPEEDLLEQAEPEVAERLILKRCHHIRRLSCQFKAGHRFS